MRQGIAGWRATGAESSGPHFTTLLAEGYRKIGRIEEGLALLAEALDVVHTTGELYSEAELSRLKGELMLQGQDSEFKVNEVEACFQQALDVARQQHAKSWELRAATSLARLWQGQGKGAESRGLLAPIYNWFTEGFDTADLKDAKTLLDALAEGESDSLRSEEK